MVRKSILAKWTNEEIQKYFDDNAIGFKLVSNYINNTIKIDIVCPHGHESSVLWTNFRRKANKCPVCLESHNKKISEEKIRNIIETDEGYMVIEVINPNRAIVKCPKNHEYNVHVANFQAGRRCKQCYEDRRLLSIEKVRSFIEVESDSGYELIAEDYKNSRTVTLKCLNGHVYSVKYDSFQSGSRCIKCSDFNNIKYDYFYVKDRFEEKGYKLLSETYDGVSEKLLVICDKGHLHEKRFSSFLRGDECQECYFERNRGNRHSSWKGGVSSLNEFLRTYLYDWKVNSLKSTNYTCDVTCQKGTLEIHHLFSFHKIVENVMTYLNLDYRESMNMYSSEDKDRLIVEINKYHSENLGVPLLKEVHTLFHQTFGFHNNTHEQYLFFKEHYQEILAGNMSAEDFYIVNNKLERDE